MALINCPRCGKQISSAAVACPHCGFRPGVDALPNNNAYVPQAPQNNTYAPQAPYQTPQAAQSVPPASYTQPQQSNYNSYTNAEPAALAAENATAPSPAQNVPPASERPIAPAGNASPDSCNQQSPYAPQTPPYTPGSETPAASGYQMQTPAANAQATYQNIPPQAGQPPAYNQPQPGYNQNYAYNSITYNQNAPKPKKKKTALLAGILAAILSLSAAGWYFLVPQTYTALNADNSYIKMTRLGSKYTQDYGDGDIVSGTFTTKGTTLTMQPVGDSSYSYTTYKNFLLNGDYELYDGSLSANALFDATITKDYEYTTSNGVDTYILFMYIFETSGKCSYGLAIYYDNELSTRTLSYGTYTVNGGKVSITYTSGDKAGENAYLVYDGSLIYSGVYEK